MVPTDKCHYMTEPARNFSLGESSKEKFLLQVQNVTATMFDTKQSELNGSCGVHMVFTMHGAIKMVPLATFIPAERKHAAMNPI